MCGRCVFLVDRALGAPACRPAQAQVNPKPNFRPDPLTRTRSVGSIVDVRALCISCEIGRLVHLRAGQLRLARARHSRDADLLRQHLAQGKTTGTA